ncbi:flavin monoamine oxidase family protein [Flaviflexus huanghaiensis]|uniref:flavin monoamine oxidase family protein n=1 Tax=Flaviflexus huanghaiensis TaxID=1111473 RepID=UPI0015FA71D2|nr:NAD(P)/FAD-dependent oxidoreductase [Flaviflexus huanghaiensis]
MSNHTNRVIIVGAGCAGLSAAYTLKKAGVPFTILEASERYGGRVGNRYHGEFTAAYGAGMTEPQWKTTFQYLEEFDLSKRVTKVESQTYGFPRNGKIHYVRLGKGMNPVKSLIGALRGLPLSALFGAVKFAKAIVPYRKQITASDGHDFSGLKEISRQSTAEFGMAKGSAELVNRVLNPFLGTMVLARARDVSIAHPIALMSLMQGMCVLEGGLATLTDALYDEVKDDLKLNTPVEEIVIEDGAIVGVRVDGELMEASQVICCTDAEVALNLMPELPTTMREPLETVKYSSTYNYMFGLNQRIVPDHFLSLFIPQSDNSLLTTMFDENAGSSRRAPEGTGLMHAFTAGWHDETLSAMSEEARRRTVIREVQRYFPEFPDEPLFTDVERWDKAVNLESPGQFEAIHNLLENHADDVKGLRLAGEYLFLIASTEGAFATGQKAAEEVARAEKAMIS